MEMKLKDMDPIEATTRTEYLNSRQRAIRFFGYDETAVSHYASVTPVPRMFVPAAKHNIAMHGTATRYNHHKCRCAQCTDGSNHYRRQLKGKPPKDGCVCAACDNYDETYGGLLPGGDGRRRPTSSVGW